MTSLPLFGARTDVAWDDYRWQLRNMIRDAADLAQYVNLTSAEKDALRDTARLFRVGATPYYASLMDRDNPNCPIRRQVIPLPEETHFKPHELIDPLGEDTRRHGASVVHKYPDRVLFLVVDRCAIYCRHCNRRRLVGGDTPPSKDEIEQGLDYIERTPRIRDVLLSGGDPLLLPTKRLHYLLTRLRQIPHVEIIRIGTRMPVVCPMRIDDELVAALRDVHPLYINTHFNHVKEITDQTAVAAARMADAGIPLGNQTVLLRGVNSSVRSLRALFRRLLQIRIKPYYLFQGDTVVGTDHMRTDIDTAIALMGQLRGFMSGMAIPHLAVDLPGGMGKVPIGPAYIVDRTADTVTLKNYRGVAVDYPLPQARDPQVPYDDIYFANVAADDDSDPEA